jgi:2-iminobutanoate/2-iminopropanoate deaminase
MRTTTISLIAMLSLAALLSAATSQSQTVGATYEKKSYDYAEWAKGRFSEVVTVRNAGKIIYLGGVGADENSDQGGVAKFEGRADP